MICHFLIINLFMCPSYNTPLSSVSLSFHPLSFSFSFIASLGILFAYGLVTADRGESRAHGESTLRRYSNFECVCPECKISCRRRRRGASASFSMQQKRNVTARRLRFTSRWIVNDSTNKNVADENRWKVEHMTLPKNITHTYFFFKIQDLKKYSLSHYHR